MKKQYFTNIDGMKLKKIRNSKNRENRQILLKESGYTNLQDAKKHLKMTEAKADIVYQTLMDMYNQQVQVAVKHQKAIDAKETYWYVKMANFYDTGKDLVVNNIDKLKLKTILKNVDFKKRAVLEYSDNGEAKFLPLNVKNVTGLLDNLDKFWLEEVKDYKTNYNAAIIYRIK